MDTRLYLPDARGRSATAVPGKSDLKDGHLYSALVLAHGGTGQQKIFQNPQGQSIPALKGSSITVTQAHQTTYSEVTTNLNKAGELGSGIGDAAVRTISINIEQAPIGVDGSISAWGATQLEVADIQSKCFFQFKVGGKAQSEGPVWAYPSAGGVYGSISTTANASALGVVSNGLPGSMRRLKFPIMVARTDTIEGVLGVGAGASLVFRTTTSAGAATLLTVMMHCNVRGDVR